MRAEVSSTPRPVVLKIGGSVLTGLEAYRRAAAFLADYAASGAAGGLIVVVSAQLGHTDRLAEEAREFADPPAADALDLLWSTGEHRSVALLTLALRAAGVSAAPLNAHQTHLLHGRSTPDAASRLVVLAALATHAVVVVPGFLAIREQRLITMGRGGSDLSAVLLAASLHAASCVLIKDVDGYFTSDPATNPEARHIPALSFAQAIDLADAGCPLVQRDGLLEAAAHNLPLVVRSFTGTGTEIQSSGVRVPGSRFHVPSS